jgi:hypothetical protein
MSGRFQTWLYLTAFTLTAVGGQGLHMLPGMGHGPRPAGSPHGGCCPHHDAAHSGDQHGHSPSNEHGHRVEQGRSGNHTTGCDTCPVCRFFALAKSLAFPAPTGVEVLPTGEQPFAAESSVTVCRLFAYSARGPPSRFA